MAKTATFESLPREIRTALYRIDEPERFSIQRNRFEAITIVNTHLSRVYKFVRKNKKLVTLLDKEIDNLILLRNKKVAAPAVLNRQPLKQYDMVTYAFVEGEILPGNLLPKHTKLLAETQRKLHLSFERDGRSKLADLNAARALKPIFAKANASEFAPELIKFARSIAKQLKTHELSREDITFVHGDAHFWNVVYQQERAVLIDWAEAGWASKYYDIGVTIEAILLEKKAMQRELIRAYLDEYFELDKLNERDIKLIELHVKLRFLEGMTWHLTESKEDQVLNKVKNAKFVEDMWRKAVRFDLAAAIK
ncbi:MAG: Phosphotransferase enzyme family [Actinomycetota bacterium]|jgi:Ser/Thr protein kinase RdoA (MazF antagonist)